MTYRLPPLKALRAFEAAARHLSFKVAADEIGVTSGAVSQQVRKLERSLGVDLFRRLPHGLLLTPEGAAYLPKITKVFDDLTAATEEIAPAINARKFSVGVCPKAAALLPKRWPLSDEALAPYVRERVDVSDPEALKNGVVDCLVQKNELVDEALVSVRILRDHRCSESAGSFYFVCRSGYLNCIQARELMASLNKVRLSMARG